MGMKRRRLLLAACGLLGLCPNISAQPSPRVYRVGWIVAGPRRRTQPDNPFVATFLNEMQRLGFAEGRNFIFLLRGVEGDFARVDDALRELMLEKVDVIYAGADRIARRLKQLVKSTPVVFVGFDPVRDGYVKSLARPGTNFTGVSMSASPELEAKRLEILTEVVPSARRIAFLGAAFEWSNAFSGVAVRNAASSLGVDLWQAECGEKEVASGLERIARAKPDAAFIPGSVTMYAFRRQIGEFLREYRIPAGFGFEESVEAGGLLSYGSDLEDVSRKIAGCVARILNGSNPATMPVEQPTLFRLTINLRAAKELGIAVPQSVLLRADRVIE